MKRVGIWILAAAIVCAVPTAKAAELLTDGGFELGPGGGWTEFSTNFGTPICDTGLCGFGGGTGPFAGTFWAWFGGITVYENGIVSQPIVIPTGTATLSFQFEHPVADTPADYIEARVDGIPVWVFPASVPFVGYIPIVIDISAFADGGAHTIEFFSETFSVGGDVSNFFIDDVSVTVPDVATGACCQPGACAEISQVDCAAAGGAYLGDGSLCFSPNGEVSDHVANPNLPISSALPPAVSQIVVNDSFVIADLDVDFIARHTWVGDLEVRIQGPDGTIVLLQDNICGNVDNENVIYDDEAAPLVCGSPVTGGSPLNPLSVFDGTDALGIWTISVTDNVGGDTGTLDQWSLHFDKAASNCDNVGACCTDGPGVASDCVETLAADCQANDGLFVGGPCANILDCVALFVQIDSMSATKTNRGVLVEWSTTVEQDTQGFRVLRETGTRDKAVRIISPFIPAAGSNLVGASYEFLDSERTGANARYWLEEVDIYGRVQRHGPIQVTTTRSSNGR